MTATTDDVHCERMKALVDFTTSSFHSKHPSPFGASVYHSQSGQLVSQAYDTVMQECDHGS